MVRRARLGALLGLLLAPTLLPRRPTQAVRTVSSHRFCRQVYCTVTQAWQQDAEGRWVTRREFRSQIGVRGWGKQREGDNRPSMRSGVWTSTTCGCVRERAPGRRRAVGAGSSTTPPAPASPGRRRPAAPRWGDPRQMRWLLRWLRPEAQPRVVQNR